MIKALIVLPFAYRPYFEQCVATLDKGLDILAIDNTRANLGVAESWNRGIDKVKQDSYDWLIVCSAAMRFGEAKGLDMLEQLMKYKDAHVINFGAKNFPVSKFIRGTSPGPEGGNFSWHCTAVRRDVLEEVGYFDPNFYPIYFEDIDYDLRINKVYNIFNEETLSYDKPLKWLIVPIDATDTGNGHGVKLGKVESPSEPLIAYFATKWGRHPAASVLGSYSHPFNDSKNSIAYFPEAGGRRWNE